MVKISPANAEDKRHGFDPWVRKIPWRRAQLPSPIFLPGEPPWSEEPGGLQSMRSQKVGHNRSDSACTSTLITIYQLKKKTLKLSPFVARYQGEPSLGKPEYKNKMDAQTNLKFYSEDSTVPCSFRLIVLIGFIESK